MDSLERHLQAKRIIRLVLGARSGSAEALGELFEFLRVRLLGKAAKLLPPDLQAKYGASDFVQLTFLEAQQRFLEFRGRSVGELLRWFTAILQHNIQDATRSHRGTAKRQMSRELSPGTCELYEAVQNRLPDDGPTPDETAIEREEVQALLLAVERLPPQARFVIRCRVYEDLSFEQIGARLNCSAKCVRTIWRRSVRLLQAQFHRHN
jgi:RNA polymerase sigma-70 factor (ECF subfamily)